jgi:hypothetical protein
MFLATCYLPLTTRYCAPHSAMNDIVIPIGTGPNGPIALQARMSNRHGVLGALLGGGRR